MADKTFKKYFLQLKLQQVRSGESKMFPNFETVFMWTVLRFLVGILIYNSCLLDHKIVRLLNNLYFNLYFNIRFNITMWVAGI